MNDNDLRDLQEFQEELLEAERSPWQPGCVSEAFFSEQSPFVLTMQVWTDLEKMKSPFLLAQLPDAENAIEKFEEAFRAFGHWETKPENCDPEELILLGRMMIRSICNAFAMRLRLEPPEGCKSVTGNNGLGNFLPLLACLTSQLGLSVSDALALPVARAYALVAAHRCNEGWSVSGETYANMDVPDESLIS